MSGPAAGSYDPVKATFLSPVRGETDAGEPKRTTWVSYCQRYVRVMPKTSFDSRREVKVAKQETAKDITGYRMRRDTKTEAIQVDMIMQHRGIQWEIVGIDFPPNELDEMVILCQRVNTPVTWTEP